MTLVKPVGRRSVGYFKADGLLTISSQVCISSVSITLLEWDLYCKIIYSLYIDETRFLPMLHDRMAFAIFFLVKQDVTILSGC